MFDKKHWSVMGMLKPQALRTQHNELYIMINVVKNIGSGR